MAHGRSPTDIKMLLEKRTLLRKQKKYKEADIIRNQLQQLGFVVSDNQEETNIIMQQPKESFLAVFGSGEISSTGRKVHDFIFQRLEKKSVSIAIISTPAGFQPNVTTVCEEIAQFFKHHLANYHPDITILYANTEKEANDPRLAEQLLNKDYIFIGPGSPSYAVHVLKNSLLYDTIISSVQNGASLCLASAAAIAFSQFSLPVYEIYKVGTSLFWMNGLNGYASLMDNPLSIVPHFNNTEGGEKNDTSRCFMGKKRFKELLSILPAKRELLGIDEHTAIVFDIKKRKTYTLGLGKKYTVRI